MNRIIRHDESIWDYAVRPVRATLNREGLAAAVAHAERWQHNIGADAVKILAEAKGVEITSDHQTKP